eukprot:4069902-Pyramimonas_sp.AAC.1
MPIRKRRMPAVVSDFCAWSYIFSTCIVTAPHKCGKTILGIPRMVLVHVMIVNLVEVVDAAAWAVVE